MRIALSNPFRCRMRDFRLPAAGHRFCSYQFGVLHATDPACQRLATSGRELRSRSGMEIGWYAKQLNCWPGRCWCGDQ